MEASAFPLDEILSAVKRRLWLMILCVVVITPVGVMTAISLPSVYSSTAKILVEGQQIPDILVRSTVQVSAAERMALLQQRLLTRQNVLELAERLGLFANRPDLSQTQIYDRVFEAIEIRAIRLSDGSSRGPALSAAFTITYNSPDRNEAARVANELVSMSLEQNIENRSRRASETRLFLQNKVRDLAASLVTLEQNIAKFKADNDETLPESLQSRRTELSSLRNRSFELQREVNKLEERKIFLEESLRLGVPAVTGVAPLSPEEADLQQLERQLAQASAIYAESHPNVRRLNSQIAALQNVLAERREPSDDAAEGAPESAGTASTGGPTGSEGAIRREVDSIDRQITLIQLEIGTIEDRLPPLVTSIAETPQVEIALIALERQHANLSAQYQDSVRKEAAAADGEELEINRQGERFSVLEPAQVPEAPDWPPRKLIAIGGAGGSVALGAFLMLAAEFRNQSVRTAGQIERRLNLRPLVTIPMVRTKRDIRRRYMLIFAAIILLILAVCVALFLIDQFYMPLDLLLEKLLDRVSLLGLGGF